MCIILALQGMHVILIRTKDYWEDFKTINEGKLAGWILDREERGMRMKA